MRQAHVVHDALGPGMDFTFRVVEKLEHQTIANQVRRVQTYRLLELQKLIGAVVGRFELPPELEPEQALIEAARPFAICNAQPDVIENRSVTGHYSLP